LRYNGGVRSLTKQLVNKRAARKRPARRGAAEGSRERLLAAAARQFAARGFAGTSVDRVAAAARVNKAMIYYHFGSKAALYRQILRGMFEAVALRARAVAASDADPRAKIASFVEGIAAEAEARPDFPPIWFREVAEGATHVDAAILRQIDNVLGALADIIDEGAAAGRFRPTSPLVLHMGIVAPLMMFYASGQFRARLTRGALADARAISRDQIVGHVRDVALGVLEGRVG
jgi:TetR/AcrR family transcriptional regulator